MMCGSFSRVALAIAVVVFVFVVHADGLPSPFCSRTCAVERCSSLTIRYGKYCGLGYTGCPGEQPCDELDRCCMVHDNCVGLKGMTYVNCHKQFKRCVNRLSRKIKRSKGKVVGFSAECPYSLAIATTYRGMQHGIFFSQIGNIVDPLKEKLGVGPTLSDGQVGFGAKDGLQVGVEKTEGLPQPFVNAPSDGLKN